MNYTRVLFRSTLLLSLGLLAAVALRAQPQQTRLSPEERALRLQERLSLSEEQVEKVTGIYQRAQERMTKLMEKARGDRQAMRGAMLDVTRETDEEIEALLTEEQKKEYEKFKEERRQNMPRRRPGM